MKNAVYSHPASAILRSPPKRDILTVDRIDELHTQPLAHAEHAVLNRDIVLTHLLEYGSVAEAVAIPWET